MILEVILIIGRRFQPSDVAGELKDRRAEIPARLKEQWKALTAAKLLKIDSGSKYNDPYRRSGTYTVCLSVTTSSGCEDQKCADVRVTGGFGCGLPSPDDSPAQAALGILPRLLVLLILRRRRR